MGRQCNIYHSIFHMKHLPERHERYCLVNQHACKEFSLIDQFIVSGLWEGMAIPIKATCIWEIY
eukprot:c5650_g1_i2 orf=2-190(-)